MNSDIFKEYLIWLNHRMRITHHGEKVLLLIDGFSAHLAAIELLTEKRIQLPFL